MYLSNFYQLNLNASDPTGVMLLLGTFGAMYAIPAVANWMRDRRVRKE